VSLSGLSSQTTYYYRAVSVDEAGNSSTSPAAGSAPASFATPDVTAPTISNVTATVNGSTATITWTTNESASTSVAYGPTAALGSTATGASGTSHSVVLSGLAQGTYSYRVTSADAAGNSTTNPDTGSAPRTFTIADTTPPEITNVQATGSGTTATITWTTSASATTSVAYGTTTSLGTTRTGTAGTSHSVTLTGLTPNTRYYFRVTSADAAGNSATSPAPPAAPAAYVPSVSGITHTTVADFSTGSGGYVSDTNGGEVMATPGTATEFSGTSTPSGWTSATVVSGGTTTYANGKATLNGTRIYTGTMSSGRTMSAAATLGAGQSLGWGSTSSSTLRAAFVVTSSGGMTAVMNDGLLNNRTVSIPGSWTGSQHEYRIDWSSTSATFFIDGTQVATGSFTSLTSLRAMATDPTTAAPTLVLDWVRVGPYAASTTWTSAVVDAGASVGWDTLVTDVAAPSGTTVTVQVRSGNTATAGGTGWTSWATVGSNSSITRTARYLQYRLVLTTSGTRYVSPVVRSATLTYHVL
jgi:hypothetical protein